MLAHLAQYCLCQHFLECLVLHSFLPMCHELVVYRAPHQETLRCQKKEEDMQTACGMATGLGAHRVGMADTTLIRGSPVGFQTEIFPIPDSGAEDCTLDLLHKTHTITTLQPLPGVHEETLTALALFSPILPYILRICESSHRSIISKSHFPCPTVVNT